MPVTRAASAGTRTHAHAGAAGSTTASPYRTGIPLTRISKTSLLTQTGEIRPPPQGERWGLRWRSGPSLSA